MTYTDPEKNALAKALWYQRNKELQRVRLQQRRSQKRQYVHDIKEANPTCTDCGIDYPWYCLDFDHLPEFKKSFALSSTGMRDKTMDQILEEITKCEIVCSNCHRHRTEMRKIEKRVSKDRHQ